MNIKFKEISAHWSHRECEFFHLLYTTVEQYSMEKILFFLKKQVYSLFLFLPSSKVYVPSSLMLSLSLFPHGKFFKQQKNIKKSMPSLFTYFYKALVCAYCVYASSSLKTIKTDCNRYNGRRKEETNTTWNLLHRQKENCLQSLCFLFLIPH